MTLDDVMDSVTLAQTVKAPRCVIMYFASGTVRLWEGVGNLVAGGQTFNGIGALGEINGNIQMGPGAATEPVTLSLALKASMISLALAQPRAEYRLRLCQIGCIPLGGPEGQEWLAAMDPFIFGTYLMDTLDRDIDSETSTGTAHLKLIPETGDKHFPPAGQISETDQKRRFGPNETSTDRMALYRLGMTLQF